VPRAHFFGLFFSHAELQDPQIEKHGKTETKTDQDKKHVCFLQTEVQFVVFAFLASDGNAMGVQDQGLKAGTCSKSIVTAGSDLLIFLL
jgi:hypothetical protein